MSRTCVFVCKQYETTFRQLPNGRFSPNSATTRGSWIKRRIQTEIYEKFPFRDYLPPKPQTLRVSNRYLTQSRLQIKGCIHCSEILFIPRCSRRPGSLQHLVNFLLRRTVAELRGFKFAQFSDFGLFSPYKTRKTYLPVSSLQPRGYIAV